MGSRAARIVLGGLLLAVSCGRAARTYRPSPNERASIRAELEAMLVRAAVNWNRGDLDAFMEDYLPGDSTTFVGGKGLLRGPAAIRASYAPLFTGSVSRDSLTAPSPARPTRSRLPLIARAALAHPRGIDTAAFRTGPAASRVGPGVNLRRLTGAHAGRPITTRTGTTIADSGVCHALPIHHRNLP